LIFENAGQSNAWTKTPTLATIELFGTLLDRRVGAKDADGTARSKLAQPVCAISLMRDGHYGLETLRHRSRRSCIASDLSCLTRLTTGISQATPASMMRSQTQAFRKRPAQHDGTGSVLRGAPVRDGSPGLLLATRWPREFQEIADAAAPAVERRERSGADFRYRSVFVSITFCLFGGVCQRQATIIDTKQQQQHAAAIILFKKQT
jgi:hypothetical protein